MKVKEGLPVRLTVDALPGRMFTGVVGKIGLLPDAMSAWLNPDLKLYSTEIYLDGDGGELRSGMTCRAEIIVTQYDDAVYVPVQSVVRVQGQSVVYVADGATAVRRAVKVGLDNNRMIHVTGGLSAGETVLLAPPLAPSEAPLSPGAPAPDAAGTKTAAPPAVAEPPA
jgi:HlyD family secretion protein